MKSDPLRCQPAVCRRRMIDHRCLPAAGCRVDRSFFMQDPFAQAQNTASAWQSFARSHPKSAASRRGDRDHFPLPSSISSHGKDALRCVQLQFPCIFWRLRCLWRFRNGNSCSCSCLMHLRSLCPVRCTVSLQGYKSYSI